MNELKKQFNNIDPQNCKFHIEEYDSSNKKIHSFYTFKITKSHIRISDFKYKLLKICAAIAFISLSYLLIFEFKNGIILDKILWLFSIIKKIGLFLYNCTPYSNTIMQNSNFKYAFILGTIFTTILIIAYLFLLFLENFNTFVTIFLSVIGGILNLHINYEICFIIIKIHSYYKVLAFIALLLINIILGVITMLILYALADTYFRTKQ